MKSFKILIVALLGLGDSVATSKMVDALGECVDNSSFLFSVPEEACPWSHGLSREMFVSSSKSLMLSSSLSISFI